MAADSEAERLDKARDLLVEVARSVEVMTAYPNVSAALDDAAIAQIAEIAWRHQFATDRHLFKKDLHDVETYVVKKLMAQEES